MKYYIIFGSIVVSFAVCYIHSKTELTDLIGKDTIEKILYNNEN